MPIKKINGVASAQSALSAIILAITQVNDNVQGL